MNEPQRNRTKDDADRRLDKSVEVPPLDKDPPPGKLPSDADVQAERQPDAQGETAS
jgi:hypothetical protein